MSAAIHMRRPAPPPRIRLPFRAFVLVAAVCLAYHFSLQSLVTGLSLQTPLGYLALVPVIALLIGASTFVTQPRLRPIHDRQLDWIVAIACFGAAATIDLLLPSAFSTDFWLHRLDLIGLPFFVAGLVSILYGVRRLWAVRWAVLFLLLAWPIPYETVLAGLIGSSTDATLSIVTAVSRIVPLAQPLGDGTFIVSHAGLPFSVSVGSACSGINSIVGFFLLGTAWNAVLRGSFPRRVAWLVAGFVLVGMLNVLRIEAIFTAGAVLGAPFAFDVLHPIAGMAVFALGALVMLGLAGPFGLRLALDAPRRAESRGAPTTPATAPATTPAAATAPAAASPRRPAGRVLVRAATPFLAILVVAALLAVPDGAFAHYQNLVDGFGEPALGTIDPSTVVLDGWITADLESYGQATQYFGPHATWDRVAFTSVDAATDPGTAYLDVIRTDDSSAFSAYGIEACYSFHGFSSNATTVVDVGAGVQARRAMYRSPNGGTDWAVLWWEWPYDAGTQTRFERLVLLEPVPEASPASTTAALDRAQTSVTIAARSIVTQAMQVQARPISEVQP